MNHKKKLSLKHLLPTFGSFSFFQASLWLGVDKVLQKLTKPHQHELRHLFQSCFLISRKCPRTPSLPVVYGQPLFYSTFLVQEQSFVHLAVLFHNAAKFSVKLSLSKDYGHPERGFFLKSQTFGLGQTNWAKHFGGIGVFSAKLSVLILVQWVPFPCFPLLDHYFYKKYAFLYPHPKYLFWIGIWIWATIKDLAFVYL